MNKSHWQIGAIRRRLELRENSSPLVFDLCSWMLRFGLKFIFLFKLFLLIFMRNYFAKFLYQVVVFIIGLLILHLNQYTSFITAAAIYQFLFFLDVLSLDHVWLSVVVLSHLLLQLVFCEKEFVWVRCCHVFIH